MCFKCIVCCFDERMHCDRINHRAANWRSPDLSVIAISLYVFKHFSTVKYFLVSFLGSTSGSLPVYSAGNKPTPGSVCVINFFRHLPAVQ